VRAIPPLPASTFVACGGTAFISIVPNAVINAVMHLEYALPLRFNAR
jgi:hypothetical protein